MSTIKIHNFREEFATNSSSTHSVIVLPNGATLAEEQTDEDYGWGNFTLIRPEHKKNYFYSQLAANLGRIYKFYVTDNTTKYAERAAQSFFGLDFSDVSAARDVDHQSVWDLPRSFDGIHLHERFVKDLYKDIMRDDVVVLGGNDNSDGHPDQNAGPGLASTTSLTRGNLVARYDAKYDFYTLFNTQTGYKARLRVGTTESVETPILKSSAPELIDIKITDFCDIGCKYCYQGSTAKGKHASDSWLTNLAWALKKHEVFEVALGGGEPTTHPEFDGILETFHGSNVKCNFTTKSLAWLDKPAITKAVKSTGANFAYSVTSVTEMAQVLVRIKEAFGDTERLKFQYVMGSTAVDELLKIVAFAKKNYLKVTLLGFKRIGRGKKYLVNNYDNALQALCDQTNGYLKLSLDTALIAEWKDQLLSLGAKREMFTEVEGAFSMYIDAVAQTAAPSSYCSTDQYVKFQYQDLLKIFESFPSEIHTDLKRE